jgi:hypothetical protein
MKYHTVSRCFPDFEHKSLYKGSAVISLGGDMKSILLDSYNTCCPSDNVLLFDHLSIQIPTTSDEDSDHHTKQFYIDQFLLAVHLLDHGQEEPSTCISGLSVIIKLFRIPRYVIQHQCSFHDSVFDFLFRTVTDLLDYKKSIVDEVAQNEEYVKAFDGLIPEKLRGFELIWRNVFDYHRSIALENRTICRLGCEALFLILHCDCAGDYSDDKHRLLKLSQSTYMLALSSIMGSMLKYGEDDDIMSYGAGAICIIVSYIHENYVSTSRIEPDVEVLPIFQSAHLMPIDHNNEVLAIMFESLKAVSKTVRGHIGSVSFIIDFCCVVRWLDFYSGLYYAMAHQTLSLCELFVDILREHHQDPAVTCLALKIIENLLYADPDNLIDRFSSTSVIEMIVLVINLHILDIHSVLPGFKIMDYLAWHSPSNRILLGSAGACETVVRAFSETTQQTAELQGDCRSLVRALAYGNMENKNRLLHSGAGDWVPQLNDGGWLDGD